MKIKNPFNLLDNVIMYGAEKAIQGFNYITGKEKKDLANFLLILDFALSSQERFKTQDYVGLAFSGFLAYHFTSLNEKQAKREESLAKKGFKMESFKYSQRKLLGYVGAIFAGSFLIKNLKSLDGYSDCFFGFSNFVMAVDTDTPYKKNILSRAIDSFKENQMNHAPTFSRERLEDKLTI